MPPQVLRSPYREVREARRGHLAAASATGRDIASEPTVPSAGRRPDRPAAAEAPIRGRPPPGRSS